MINLSKLNRQEAVRYMGGAGIEIDESTNALIDLCENELLKTVNPKFLYREIDLPNDTFLKGNDIKAHLSGCHKAVIMCATLGSDVDRLLRTLQITDMAKAVITDALASVAIEQVGSQFDSIIASDYDGLYLTFRFSPGYGDYPIEMQSVFLNNLDAQRKIGLCTNSSFLLTPTKSITAIMGISHKKPEQKRIGCASCNLNKTCKFRKAGSHCGF